MFSMLDFQLSLYSAEGYEKEGIVLMNISGFVSSVPIPDITTARTVCNIMGYGYIVCIAKV